MHTNKMFMLFAAEIYHVYTEDIIANVKKKKKKKKKKLPLFYIKGY